MYRCAEFCPTDMVFCTLLRKPFNLVLCKQFFTTKLDTNKLTPEQRMKAEQVAAEIERENKMGKYNRTFGEVRTSSSRLFALRRFRRVTIHGVHLRPCEIDACL